LSVQIHSHTHYTDQILKETVQKQEYISSSEFIDCKFMGCSFVESVFSTCRFISCTFQGCDLSLIQLPGSIFSATRFEDSKIIGVDWTQVNWTATTLGDPISFFNSTLNHATFIGLKLSRIVIKDCIASNVDFRETDLSQSDFSGTDLSDSLFVNTDLTAADLSRARNYQIAPGQNIIKQAKFSLPDAMSLLYNLDIDLIGDT
jgi:fluoroquinolone resistance protein